MEAVADATGNRTLSRCIHWHVKGGHLTVSYAACKTVVKDAAIRIRHSRRPTVCTCPGLLRATLPRLRR